MAQIDDVFGFDYSRFYHPRFGLKNSRLFNITSKWPYLENAVYTSTQAIKEEKNRNYDLAVKLYETAVAFLIYSEKHEAKTQEEKDALTAKYKLYEHRAALITSRQEKKITAQRTKIYFRQLHGIMD